MIDPKVREILGLPEGIQELSYYTLLDLNPSQVTPEAVKAARLKRTQQLQAYADQPEMKKTVAALARQILEAAEVLSDNARRIEYDHELDVRRQRIQREARKKFRTTVELALEDGKLPADRVEELLGRASQIGISEVEARRIIQTFPLSKTPSTRQPSPAPAVEPVFDISDLAQADDRLTEVPEEEPAVPLAPQASDIRARTSLPTAVPAPIVAPTTLVAVYAAMALCAASAIVSVILLLTAQ